MYLFAQTADDAAGLLGVLAGFAIFGLILLVLLILTVVALYKLFEKAGRNGWEALVQYHNYYVALEISGRPPIYVLFLVFGTFLFIIPFLGPLLFLIGLIAFHVVLGIDFAKSFGRTTGFGVGCGLLPFVFLPILAFSDPTYYGPAGPEGQKSGGYQPPPGAVPPGQYGGGQGFGSQPPQQGGFGAPAAPQQGSWGQPAPQQDQGSWGQPDPQQPQQPPQQGGWGDQGGQQPPPGWG